MSLEQIIILAFVQGLTEFLPVSSSGHLVLVPYAFGWTDQGMIMDVAAHMGTLASVLIYFYKDVGRMFCGAFDMMRGRMTLDARLVINLAIASVPAVILGMLFEVFIGDAFRSVSLIAIVGMVFGLILYAADRMGRQTLVSDAITFKQAFYFGLAQAISLVNGVSRSGACITAGRFMNFTRSEAAHFAFLMSIPTITGAGMVKCYKLCKIGDYSMMVDASLMAGLSFFSGIAAIWFMMRWLQTSSLTVFMVYRMALGVVLLSAVYLGYIAG